MIFSKKKHNSHTTPAMPERIHNQVDENEPYSLGIELPTVAAKKQTPISSDSFVIKRFKQKLPTALSISSYFRGTLTLDRSAVIEGIFQGELNCRGAVVIGEGAIVSGDIRCQELYIFGEVTGETEVEDKLEVFPEAKFIGTTTTENIVVHENCHFKGGYSNGYEN
jgi:cytoskeletal protein CcmA (bactofilin family)